MQAIKLSPKYEKAYFRLVKGLIQLNRMKEARMCLIIGFNECSDSKHLKTLEKEIFDITGIPVRPKPHDFETIEELGDGNFSKIYKTIHKPTNKIYAIKTIEKMTVERMKRRHPNIHNEILIEKRTLNKLEHPNIVSLFATFQDYGTLYYQMEFLEGGEVWSHLQDERTKASVGCYESLAKFWIAEAINALEYMHKKGIVHRDVKPENMILDAHGRLKFVDFGTCKDLLVTDLNGQEFVGTAEYMSPEVVQSKPSGPETDLWSLGAVIYQMMVGYTPFLASSPYLSFLRIKRGFVRIPRFFEEGTTEIINLLIHKNKKERFANAAYISTVADEGDESAKVLFSYDKLRELPFFRNDPDFLFPDPYNSSQPPVKVPSLRDIAFRALGQACIAVADKVAANGGSRHGLEKWIQDFTLSKLSEKKRYQLLHYLNRRGDAHNPAVYRLFWNSVVDARCVRSEWTEREILGFNRHTNGRYAHGFSFAYLGDPLFGYSGQSCEIEEKNLRSVVSALNKLRPKFVVVNGNFVSTEQSSLNSGIILDTQTELFRRTVARISETVPVVFVPGEFDIGVVPTPESIGKYHTNFGCDFYGFWFDGVRFLVINTTLMLHPELVPDHAAYQDIWLDEELEQCKLCAIQVVIFSHHPWFLEHGDEDDGPAHEKHQVMPKSLRDKWLPKMRHQKIKYLFSSKCTNPNIGHTSNSFRLKPSSRATKIQDATEDSSKTTSTDQINDTTEEGSSNSSSIDHPFVTDNVDEDGEILKPNPNWKELPPGVSSETETDTDEDDEDGTKQDKDSPFSPDMKYSGPLQISTPPVGTMTDGAEIIRIVEIVDEDSIHQTAYSLQNLPSKLTI